ncbi:MAG: hypothetical protein HGB17_17240, partial [Syntrophobacteraceae bacterium]|nr:hypothetical protein [Syntrophobacteraceae bacterium]
MSEKIPAGTDIVGAISERFRSLIRSLLRGNVRRARVLAGQVRDELHAVGRQIAVQDLIEDLAQGQAIRNAFINLPSAVPGIGTIISWVLISVEDFFTLDQGVTLILTLSVSIAQIGRWLGNGIGAIGSNLPHPE